MVETIESTATCQVDLLSSAFESSAGGVHRHVLLLFDRLQESASDQWIVSLNGVGDSEQVALRDGGSIRAGFVDTDVSDNRYGSSVGVSIRDGREYVAGH